MRKRAINTFYGGFEEKEVSVARRMSRRAVSTKMLAAGLAITVFGGCAPDEPSKDVNTATEATSAADDAPIAADQLAENILGQTVVIEGEVTGQCPSSGCWLTVETSGGEAFVELSRSGSGIDELLGARVRN